MTEPRPVEVADGVHFVHGLDVNWVIVRDGDDVTLIDAGYPGQVAAVEASIRAVGARPEDVRAILVTHAHVDHVGAVVPFLERYRTPVCFDSAELPNARGERRESARVGDVLANSWRPGVLPWALRVARLGARKPVAIGHAQALPAGGALDLPGHPVPVATHGHTSGHTAYHLPEAGVVITGDALVTGHPTSLIDGPQLLPSWFDHGGALAGLEPLETLAADVVLPGHGDVHRGPIATAVAKARSRIRR